MSPRSRSTGRLSPGSPSLCSTSVTFDSSTSPPFLSVPANGAHRAFPDGRAIRNLPSFEAIITTLHRSCGAGAGAGRWHRRENGPMTVPSGVGKTTVAYEVSAMLAARDVAHALIDTDNLDHIHPPPADDPTKGR